MKAIKRLACLLCLCVLLVGFLPIRSHAEEGTCGENITWTYEKGGLFISGTGEMNTTPPGHIAGATRAPWYDLRNHITHVVIEPGITSISSYAFWHCHALITVTIPDTVTTIGESAFNECWALENIQLPSGITEIPKNAFTNCSSLSQLNIPDGVTSIGNDAFQGCTQLSAISLPEGLKQLGTSAFGGCQSLESIVIPEAIVYIPDSAFAGCHALFSVTLHPNVQGIGRSAFSGCSALTTIQLPASVRRIEWDAFHACSSLKEVHISDLRAWCTILYGDSQTNPLLNGASLYLNGEMITDLVIPEDMSYLYACAFAGCRGLQSVTLPEGMTNIASYAFQNCTDLTSIRVPSTVTGILDSAFYGCNNLTTVYYYGTAEQLAKLQVHRNNDILTQIPWQYANPVVYQDAMWSSIFGSWIRLGIGLLVAGACVFFTRKRWSF